MLFMGWISISRVRHFDTTETDRMEQRLQPKLAEYVVVKTLKEAIICNIKKTAGVTGFEMFHSSCMLCQCDS